MNKFFPGKKTFFRTNEHGAITGQWSNDALDWKAKVVCKTCNEGWMSEIETQHARPAMEDILRGKVDIPITQSRARSLAVFAFKSAVVVNHMRRNVEPFFSQATRVGFRESLVIPSNVYMWLAGFLPMGKGEIRPIYHDGTLPDGSYIKL